jgi:Pyridoxamine 5'-phosphate oxidase
LTFGSFASFNRLMPKPAKRKPVTRTERTPDGGIGKQPVASRPAIPADYGISKSTKGMLNWSWARERLTKSHNYVIVTVRPDGRPHAMGMHGLWFGDAFYFGTGETTRKAKNLAANPNCTLVNERLDELIIVEGTAEQVGYDALPPALSAASKKKYGWPYDPRMGGVIFKVTPRVVFALPEKQFATAPTRWEFD